MLACSPRRETAVEKNSYPDLQVTRRYKSELANLICHARACLHNFKAEIKDAKKKGQLAKMRKFLRLWVALKANAEARECGMALPFPLEKDLAPVSSTTPKFYVDYWNEAMKSLTSPTASGEELAGDDGDGDEDGDEGGDEDGDDLADEVAELTMGPRAKKGQLIALEAAGASTKEVADAFFPSVEGAVPSRFVQFGWLTQRPVETYEPPLFVKSNELTRAAASEVVVAPIVADDDDDEPMSLAPSLSQTSLIVTDQQLALVPADDARSSARVSLSQPLIVATAQQPTQQLALLSADVARSPAPRLTRDAPAGMTAAQGPPKKAKPAAIFHLGAATRGPSSGLPSPPRPPVPARAPPGKFWFSGGFNNVPLVTMDAPTIESIHQTDLKHNSFPCPCPRDLKKGAWVKPRNHNSRGDCLHGYALKINGGAHKKKRSPP
jgi:hypothetical protein